MDPDLIAKYERQRVPRYTSYPTAPHFSPAVGPEKATGWLRALDPGASLSLYLHVPYCRSMCWYCGCHTKVTKRREPIEAYLAALRHEIDLVAALLPAGPTVRQVHWGGGTPTIVGAPAFADLMDTLRARFAFAPDAEVAIEIDPREANAELVAGLAEAGVNRASLGVQTFDPAVQQAINRVQSFECTQATVEALRAAGVGAINFDLIYGLPQQTVMACEDVADGVRALAPDRLAVFGYAHVPWMKPHQRMIDEATLPGGRQRVEQFAALAEQLDRMAYRRIGLDHFAKPTDALARCLDTRSLRRNFQGYTTDPSDALIGFGASAISALPQGYAQNAPAVAEYARRVGAGQLAVDKGIALSADDLLRRDAIEAIMCYQDLDVAALGARHGRTPDWADDARPALEALEADGVVHLEGPRVTLADEAWPLMRSVAAAFDTYLKPTEQRHARAL